MPEYDVLIKGATIVDGTGRPAYQGSVGIVGDRIADIGALRGSAKRVIDGAGLTLTPGFIDPHSHAERTILMYPLAESFIMQGCTTFMGGNCGNSIATIEDEEFGADWVRKFGISTVPDWHTFGEFADRIDRAGIAMNCAMLIGEGAVRCTVMRNDFKRCATAAEVARMKEHVAEAMDHGAFGLSLAMDYQSEYADCTGEIVELLKLVEARGGVFAPHTRDLDMRWPVEDRLNYGYGKSHWPREDSWIGRYHGLVEAIDIARQANRIKTHIAHLPPAYSIFQPHPDGLEEHAVQATLEEFVDRPGNEGIDVSFNVMGMSVATRTKLITPFMSKGSNAHLALKMPEWLCKIEKDEFVALLGDRAFRDRLNELVFSGVFKFEMALPRVDPYWIDQFRVAKCKIKAYEGKTIGELARARSPENTLKAVYNDSVEVVLDMIQADPDTEWDFLQDKRFNPNAMRVTMKHPRSIPMIDGSTFPAEPVAGFTTGMATVYYSMFADYLDRFVKRENLLTREQAVYKVTGFPAQKVFGFVDRGTIRPGAFADINLLDWDNVRCVGDFGRPNLPPEGIEYVLVNGAVAYENKKHTGVRSGRVIRKA